MLGYTDRKIEGWTDGMNGQIEGQMYVSIEEWTDERTDIWKDGQMEGWTDGMTDRWKDGQMEGQTVGRTDSWEEWADRRTGRWKDGEMEV